MINHFRPNNRYGRLKRTRKGNLRFKIDDIARVAGCCRKAVERAARAEGYEWSKLEDIYRFILTRQIKNGQIFIKGNNIIYQDAIEQT